jgi:ankyrin repeat protein
MGGIAACLLGLILVHVEIAAASCPGWRPPIVPTVEKARASALCKGTPFEERVEALKRADPEADANAQAGRGSFRLMRFLPPGECGPVYPGSFEAFCKLTPETTLVEHQAAYLDAFARLYENQTDDVDCATVYGALIEDYVRRFNRTLIEHARYPNKDLCRYIPFKGDWSVSWKEEEAGPKLHERPKAEDTPATFGSLPAAARFGDVEAVKRLLAQGIKPAARDDWLVTALEWSVIRGYEEVFELLVTLLEDHGQEFCAGLEDAIRYDRPAMVDALIRLCAKQPGAGAANDRNRLINHVAGRGSIALLQSLVAAGFSVKAGPPADFDEDLRDPDQVPIPYRPLGASDAWRATAASPLHAAAAKGHSEVAEFLLKLGADINLGGPGGLPPIYAAIGGKQPEMVDLLLRRGAKLDADAKLPEHIGTPIQFAIDRGNADTIRVLAEHGVNLDQSLRNGTPVIFLAASRYAGNKDALATMLRLGANPNLQSKEPDARTSAARFGRKYRYTGIGRTPIMHVIATGWVRCGDDMHVLGPPAKVDPRLPTDCRHEGLPVVELLLTHGARLEVTDADGHTALHYAASTDYGLEIAALLLSKGADVNARDKAGRTPLDLATELGLQRMPPLLIRYGGKSAQYP